MSIKEYISTKFRAFDVTDADLIDFSLSLSKENVDIEDTLTLENENILGKHFCAFLVDFILRPKQKSISEGGYSQSYEFTDIYKWYQYLCGKYGVQEDEKVQELIGISKIKDASNLW